MMVPVNLRGTDGPGELGNRISLVPVTIPLDIRNPRKLLASVHKRTELLKRAHTAELVSLAGGLIGMFPNSAQALAGHIISRLPFTPFNMVCTNVPGPQQPLYLLGHKMLCTLSVCSGRGRDGAQLRHFDLRRHGVFRVQRMHARRSGSAAFGNFSKVEFHGAAGIRRGHDPHKERKKKRIHTKAKVASKPAPATVRVPVALRPLVSVDSTKIAVPPVKEENVLTRLIA